MAAILQDYNLALVQIVLGDFPLSGFAADDAISISPMSDDFEAEASIEGKHVAINRINDPRHECTIRVRRGSVGFRLLWDAYASQLEASDSGAVPTLAFSCYDPVSGDKIVERQFRFLRGPDMGFGRSAGVAEFKALLPSPVRTGAANVQTSF